MKNKGIVDIKLERLRDSARNAFSEQSDSYKQKLIYSLLNTINASDKEKFQWLILRVANSKKADAKEFVEILSEFQSKIKTKEFEDIAYAIVMGIMSSYSEKEE